MARSAYVPLTGAGHALFPTNSFLDGFFVKETAGAAATVDIRDAFASMAAPTSAPDGVAGVITAGLHYYAWTLVTLTGESMIGGFFAATSAGTVKVTVNAPLAKAGARDQVVGRNLYATKAGAPAANLVPTTAQTFLGIANPTTTVAAGANQQALPQASIVVASTTNFAAAGNIQVAAVNADGVSVQQLVSYTSTDATHFLGCTGGAGTLVTGAAVKQPTLPDNTSTSLLFNVADGSFTATTPPVVDRSGSIIVPISLAASESTGEVMPFTIDLLNGGGVYFDVVTGTVAKMTAVGR